MKRFITGMIISMMVLVGCGGPDATTRQIREGGRETFLPGSRYDTEQEDAILFSDLQTEFQKSNMHFIKDTHPDALTEEYYIEDDRVTITVLVDKLIWQEHAYVKDIFIAPRNNYMLLSQHPAVKAIASVIGEDELLTWLVDQEGDMTKAGKDGRNIEEVLAMDRCYVSFAYWVGSDTRSLAFTWLFKPSIPKTFEKIAHELEKSDMLTTGYIGGLGGETLTAINTDYYRVRKVHNFNGDKISVDVDQAAAYQVMHDTNKPDNYSVQLRGYMRGDLAYPTKVEAMPGLDKITQLMNMGQEELLAITDEINKELTEAKRIRNSVYKGEYYVEGQVGDYRYAITVPSGSVLYNFTVLIEKI